MSLNTPYRPDNPMLDAAWRAFADEDARMQAPPDLEARLLAVVQNRSTAPHRPSRRMWMAALPIAAGLLLATSLGSHLWGPVFGPAPPDTTLAARASIGSFTTHRAAVSPAPARGELKSRPERRLVAARSPRPNALPPILMSLGAAPLRATEPLQLARLRLPREALQALGVALLEPDAGGVVDVEVLVGEDGLARDIRQVRSGQEQRP